LGGVARNVAEAVYWLGQRPLLISPIGNDDFAKRIQSETRRLGMIDVGLVELPNERTPTYNAILDPSGQLLAAGADMDALQKPELYKYLNLDSTVISESPIVCFDANLGLDTVEHLMRRCKEKTVPIAFEPTSVPKCRPIVEIVARNNWKFNLSSPNRDELIAMAQFVKPSCNPCDLNLTTVSEHGIRSSKFSTCCGEFHKLLSYIYLLLNGR
jgi:pseudouridine-5'-phosphate glycosidase/pseudouridine kinase